MQLRIFGSSNITRYIFAAIILGLSANSFGQTITVPSGTTSVTVPVGTTSVTFAGLSYSTWRSMSYSTVQFYLNEQSSPYALVSSYNYPEKIKFVRHQTVIFPNIVFALPKNLPAGNYLVGSGIYSGSTSVQKGHLGLIVVTRAAPAPPSITTQPSSVTITEGSSATFSVATSGSGLGYQWNFKGTAIPDANSSSYTIASASVNNSGNYSVLISNSAGSVLSNTATLMVDQARPVIISQPVSQTVTASSAATFSVIASGSSLNYQWSLNSSPVPGATGSSYTIASATASTAGTYSVQVSNSAGSVTSAPATLQVNASGAPTFALNFPCATAVVVGLQWGAADPTVTQYQIFRNGVSIATTPNLYFADTTVAATTSYSYVVTAQNSAGTTLRSNTISVATAAASPNGDPAYCPSSVVKSMTWNWATAFNQQSGSDLWSVTWGSDGSVFSFFGDGGGFGGSGQNGRTSFGIAQINRSTPLNSSNVATNAANIFGGFQPGMAAGQSNFSGLNGKASSLIAIGANLYATAGIYRSIDSGGPSGAPNHQEIVYSTSGGTSWTDNFWLFCSDSSDPNGFCAQSFINFGPGNAGARDGYVYIMGTTAGNWFSNTALPGPANTYLARVPNDQLLTQTAYEVFTGFDSSGSPTWSQLYSGAQSNGDPIYVSTTVMQPIFTDQGPRPIGIEKAVYNPILGRYIAVGQGSIAQAAFYESVNPWGPWYSIAYYNTNSDGSGGWGNMGTAGSSLGINFVNAWTSSDGLTMWATFSSDGTAPTNISDPALAGRDFDSFNLVSVVLGQ